LASFGKRVDGPGGRRWLRRKWVRTAASAVFGDGATAVLIENLSLTGARLRGFGLPMLGTDLEVIVGERSLSGRVAWAAGDQRGISFNFGRR
jgi:3-oxoacyl-[acyl-carrier-protein] synthase III